MFSRKSFGVCCVAVMAAALPAKQASAQCGKASWYHEGSRTATGERYRPDGITAAHKTLPFGTVVQVQHQRTGRTVTVRINDRGPFVRGRIIDLSRGAKRVLGMDGVAPVCITVLGRGGGKFADAGSLFGSDDSYTQPRGRHHGRHHARTARLDRDFTETRRYSRRHRVAHADTGSVDFGQEETRSRRPRRHAKVHSRARGRYAPVYRGTLAGWPGVGSEM